MEYVWNIDVDIFCLRCQSSSECVEEEVMLLMEWRDVWRGTETECVWSVEADILRLRSQLIEVSPNRWKVVIEDNYLWIKLDSWVSTLAGHSLSVL